MNFKNSLIDVWLSSSVLGRQFFRYKCSRYCSAYSFPGSSLCLKMLISLSRYSRLLAWYNAVGKAREGPDGRCRVRMEWFCKSNEKDPGLISASFFCFTRKNRQIIHPLHFRVNHLFITYSGKLYMNYFPSKQMPVQGFGTYSGEKYGLSGNEIWQVKPHHSGGIAF